jgi:hypothetical protein
MVDYACWAFCRRSLRDLLDVVGWPYDGINHVVIDDVHETMLDPGESDHPLAAMGVSALAPQ